MAVQLFALLLAAQGPATTPPMARPQRVCRESELHVGSHIRSGRRCMTQEEWNQEDARRDQVPLTLRVTADPEDAQRAASQPH